MKRMWSKNELRKIIQETYGIDINNLIDENGHERFLKGDIEINEITGVTKSFGKWSLSGTHLLIVLALDIADATELTNGTIFTILNLPDWIKEQIVELKGAYVERKTFPMVAANWSTQDLQCTLGKSGTNFVITCRSSTTLTADRSVRISFDLEID